MDKVATCAGRLKKSVLFFEIAEKLGRQYRLNAIIFVRVGRPAELMCLN
jgi:hypothetical protein